MYQVWYVGTIKRRLLLYSCKTYTRKAVNSLVDELGRTYPSMSFFSVEV